MPKKIPMVISNNVAPTYVSKSVQAPVAKSAASKGGFKGNMIKRIQYARAGCGSCGGK